MSKTPADRRQAWIDRMNKKRAAKAARNMRIMLENMQPAWSPRIFDHGASVRGEEARCRQNLRRLSK